MPQKQIVVGILTWVTCVGRGREVGSLERAMEGSAEDSGREAKKQKTRLSRDERRRVPDPALSRAHTHFHPPFLSFSASISGAHVASWMRLVNFHTETRQLCARSCASCHAGLLCESTLFPALPFCSWLSPCLPACLYPCLCPSVSPAPPMRV